mgnify:CR=1 FL=1
MKHLLAYFSGVAHYYKGAFFLLRHASLWKYVLIPWGISLFVFLAVVFAYLFTFSSYIAPWAKTIELPKKVKSEFVDALLKILGNIEVDRGKLEENIMLLIFLVLFGIVALIIFFVVQSIASKSFNERLSCKVEEMVSGKVMLGKSMGFWQGVWQATRDKLKFLKSAFLLGMLLLGLNFIPGIGQAASFLVAGYYTGISYLDYVFDRRKYSYDLKKKKIKRHLAEIVGFGSVCFLVLMVPGLNILLMPFNVVSGTLLGVECSKVPKKKKPIKN